MDNQYGWELAMILVMMPMIFLGAFLFALGYKFVEWLWRLRPSRTAPRPTGGSYTWESAELRELVARIHGDGGHYIVEHGMEKAVRDAHIRVAQLRAMAST